MKILVNILPLSVFLWFGRRLGELILLVIKSRRKIVTKNLKLAFPKLGGKQLRQLRLKHFRSVGMGLCESLYAWNADPEHLKTLATVEGLDNIPDNQGTIIMFFHFTSVVMGCTLLGLHAQLNVVYRKDNNLKINKLKEQGMRRVAQSIITSNDLRSMLKVLKSNNILLYAADQSSTKSTWTFVDLFNNKMAVTTASTKIVKATGAKVLPLSISREKSSYKITVHPAFAKFGEDPKQDAQTMMSFVEAEAKRIPEQYFWIHNIFKPPPADSLNRLLK